MTRALLWKEWREQRAFLFGGLAVALALPVVMVASELQVARTGRLGPVVENLPVLFAAVLWPVLAAATGARTLAGESDDRTLPFLLSRPVSRVGLWTIKVSTALGVLVGGIGGSLLIAGGFQWLTSVEGSLFAERLFVSSLDPLAMAAGSLLLFAAAVLFSTFLDQPLTAAAGGLAASLLIGAGLLFVGGLLSLHPVRDLHVLAGEAVLAAALLLLGSLAAFARPELTGRALGGRTWALGAVAAVTVAGLVLLPAIHVARRVPLDDAWIDPDSVRQARNTIAVTATARDGSRRDVWLVRGDGSGALRLAGPDARVAAVSADGNQIAYVTRRGFPGVRGRSTWDLRVTWAIAAVDVDRLVVPDLVAPATVVFGPPGGPAPAREAGGPAWLALQNGTELVVARLDGRWLERFDTVGTPLEGGVILAWLDEPTEVLLGVESGGRAGSLHGYDVESRAIRTIHEGPGRAWVPRAAWRWRAFSHDGRAFPVEVWPVIHEGEEAGARSSEAGPAETGTPAHRPGGEVSLLDLRNGEELARLEDVCGIDAVVGPTVVHRRCGSERSTGPEAGHSPAGTTSWELRVVAVDDHRAPVGSIPGSADSPHALLLEAATHRGLLPDDPGTPLWLSPGRRYALFWVGAGSAGPGAGDPRPAIVSSDGIRRDLPAGLRPVGWLDGRRALLMRTSGDSGANRNQAGAGPRGSRVVELLAADALTGAVEAIEPLGPVRRKGDADAPHPVLEGVAGATSAGRRLHHVPVRRPVVRQRRPGPEGPGQLVAANSGQTRRAARSASSSRWPCWRRPQPSTGLCRWP